VVAVVSLSTVLVAEEIQIRPRFAAGDTFQLEVTRSREDSAQSRLNYTARMPVDVRVISADKTGFVVDWHPGDGTVEGEAANDPGLEAANDIIGNAHFRLALDPDGSFIRVMNEAELAPKFQAMVDLILKEAEATLSADQAKTARTLVQQILAPANLIGIAARDAQQYLSMYGADLRPGQLIEVPIEQPSPVGGGNLPAVVRIRMDSATPETAMISSIVNYDGEAVKKMTLGLLSRAGKMPPPEEIEKFKLELSDDSKYVFERKTGLFREVTNDRRISSGTMKRLERCVIKLVKGPNSR
jgi:hypothetical protein